MKTIIAGSRTITDYSLVERAVKESGFEITEVVSGGQKTYDPVTRKPVGGVDFFGEVWAHKHGIPVEQFPAEWDTSGRAAGPIRNAEMASCAEALICIHTGGKGSASMLRVARAMGLQIYEVNLNKESATNEDETRTHKNNERG